MTRSLPTPNAVAPALMNAAAVERGDSFDEVLQLQLPKPFDQWQVNGMERFLTNVRYLFQHFGGEVPLEE